MSEQCWLCGHAHPEDGSYGCLQTRVPYGASTIGCYCPLKPAWARDPEKRHRAVVREHLRPSGDDISHWPVCTCGWEGLSYYKRKPATVARDEHLTDIAEALAARPATDELEGGGA